MERRFLTILGMIVKLVLSIIPFLLFSGFCINHDKFTWGFLPPLLVTIAAIGLAGWSTYRQYSNLQSVDRPIYHKLFTTDFEHSAMEILADRQVSVSTDGFFLLALLCYSLDLAKGSRMALGAAITTAGIALWTLFLQATEKHCMQVDLEELFREHGNLESEEYDDLLRKIYEYFEPRDGGSTWRFRIAFKVLYDLRRKLKSVDATTLVPC